MQDMLNVSVESIWFEEMVASFLVLLKPLPHHAPRRLIPGGVIDTRHAGQVDGGAVAEPRGRVRVVCKRLIKLCCFVCLLAQGGLETISLRASLGED